MSIKCEICGKGFLTLGHHVKIKHGISIEEYRNLYPQSLTIDKEYAKKMSDTLKVSCGTDEFRKKMSTIASTYANSEEGKRFHSEKMKRQLQTPGNILGKGAKALKYRLKTDESFRKKYSLIQSEKLKRRWSENHDVLASQVGPKKYYTDFGIFRSYAEKFLAEQLEYTGLDYQYEVSGFVYEDSTRNSTQHRYYPDFYLPKYDLFIEVKYNNSSITERDLCKIRDMSLQHHKNIVVVFQEEILKSPSIVTSILNQDMDKYFNRTLEIISKCNDYRKLDISAHRNV